MPHTPWTVWSETGGSFNGPFGGVGVGRGRLSYQSYPHTGMTVSQTAPLFTLVFYLYYQD